jgi:uroporphyrin-III C-methyltransferase
MMNDTPEAPKLRLARARASRWLVPGLAVLALAVVVLGFAWWLMRSDIDAMREEVARRVRDASAEARDSRTIAKETLEALREAQTKIGVLEAKLLESQSHQLALEALYQELSRSRDEWLLAEVEQTLAIAAQQLQLAGSVQAALVALQNADARLARSDRPQFLPLRKAIARDIDRLKATPAIDLAGMTFRIDQVITAVDQLPLLADGRPPVEPIAPDAAAGRWESTWLGIWEEIKSLVRVQRIDSLDQSLLAPEARFFVRENLKLRLLHARVALLQRDEAAFRGDIKASQTLVARYFDTKQKSVANASGTLAQLSDAAVNVELPTIADSVNAVRNFKVPRDKDSK